MAYQLVFVGEVTPEHAQAVVAFAKLHGFRLMPNKPTLLELFLKEQEKFWWGKEAEGVKLVFQSMGVRDFGDFQKHSAITVWRVLNNEDANAMFGALVGRMRKLKARFSDWDVLAECPVEDMTELPARARNKLGHEGVVDLAILKYLTYSELIDMRNLGEKTVGEIRAYLNSL